MLVLIIRIILEYEKKPNLIDSNFNNVLSLLFFYSFDDNPYLVSRHLVYSIEVPHTPRWILLGTHDPNECHLDVEFLAQGIRAK